MEDKRKRLMDEIYNYLYDGFCNGTSDFPEWCQDSIEEGLVDKDQVEKISALVEMLQTVICEEL
jgi:hypothetical protein